jgi:DNA polymerase/3'-5' exonuclease PolX
MDNKTIAEKFTEIADLLEIKGDKMFRVRAYRKAAAALESFETNIAQIYKKDKAVPKISGIGASIGEKMAELLKTRKIKYLEELKEETAIRQIITYFFGTKGVGLEELKRDSRKRDIVYSRYTKPAKQLIELAGSVEKAKNAIKIVADWANSRKLDYAIETVFKKWLELDKLKPKEIVKKPFYRDDPMIWSENRKKWFVITPGGEWLEYCDKIEKIEWRIVD